MPSIPEPRRQPHDVAILFDTAASQSGMFRLLGLAALDSLLRSLGRSDRVALVAVDLNAVSLTPALTASNSAEMNQALANLHAREPLGSTDMDAALIAASGQLMRNARPGRARSIVYIGDGMSTAQLFFSERLRDLMD